MKHLSVEDGMRECVICGFKWFPRNNEEPCPCSEIHAIRSATPEELTAQSENLNYKPGPRQAVAFMPQSDSPKEEPLCHCWSMCVKTEGNGLRPGIMCRKAISAFPNAQPRAVPVEERTSGNCEHGVKWGWQCDICDPIVTSLCKRCNQPNPTADDYCEECRKLVGERTPRDEVYTLIDQFSLALKEKLILSEQKYGWNNGWTKMDWQDDLRRDLRLHVEKGDPLDVAAYCAFAWHHGWSTASMLDPVCYCGKLMNDHTESDEHTPVENPPLPAPVPEERTAEMEQLSKWIDVKQRMPTEKGTGWYLITNGERVDVGLLLHGKTFMGHALQFSDVTHWMPLPAPPEATHER